jgi:hypothetical protein
MDMIEVMASVHPALVAISYRRASVYSLLIMMLDVFGMIMLFVLVARTGTSSIIMYVSRLTGTAWISAKTVGSV